MSRKVSIILRGEKRSDRMQEKEHFSAVSKEHNELKTDFCWEALRAEVVIEVTEKEEFLTNSVQIRAS